MPISGPRVILGQKKGPRAIIDCYILNYLNWVYYTTARLSDYGLRNDSRCPRCGKDSARFAHVAWCCRVVQSFWLAVFRELH
ncbi:hypothetical protein NDU88_012299 [Pleurodeles waltl]|uniref:Reverse transcriptase zinc-binding domain-containing protein n=1 Tax=Pleurodeles waltl TaxID=8319 RepID=A0AAV7R2G5_PLEWA|nr:hypothetical protein NDU88_012299 [Pleurodeles waltl]